MAKASQAPTLPSRPRSEAAYKTACEVFVGGVNSPVRAFRGVGGGIPVTPRQGRGAYITDLDGYRYLDYVLSYGPLILGHAYPPLISSIRRTLKKGTTFGMPTEAETELAQWIQRFFPELELIRLVNSGTEAAMSAVRLARGYTGREGLVKFAGCYHGHGDALLVRAGSGVATLNVEGSRGVPRGAVERTYLLPFNDAHALRELLHREGEKIAAVIVEVVPGNMGMVLPNPEFLEVLRDLPRYGILLITDEVLTGLRLHAGGAYHRYNLSPDLVLLGKVIGGGFPLAAYGGKRKIMEHLAPLGEVYQAGTLSGNPVAAQAGAFVLKTLYELDPYHRFVEYSRTLCSSLTELARNAGIPLAAVAQGSIFSLFFGKEDPPRNEAEVKTCDHKAYSRFFWGMVAEGVLFPPSGYEVSFISTAHGERELSRTLAAARKVFRNWKIIPLPGEEKPQVQLQSR